MKKYNTSYTGSKLDLIAFPLGGLGAGMLCIQGTGSLGSFSLRNSPDVYSEPNVFSAICVKGGKNVAKVLEGPVPKRKIFGGSVIGAGNGLSGKNYGLPRFTDASFEGRFPFAEVKLQDETIPLKVGIKGWSPFIPNDADNSSLPFAAMEYSFTNTTDKPIEAVFYFNAVNFMKVNDSATISRAKDGFVLQQPPAEGEPWREGYFYAFVDDSVNVDTAWFRGGWFDTLTMLWNNIEKGIAPDKTYPDGGVSQGASISIPFAVDAGQTKTIKLKLCWYVPETNLRFGHNFEECCTTQNEASGSCCCKSSKKPDLPKHKPWYSGKFKNIMEVHDYIQQNYDYLHNESKIFSDCLYATSLPDEVVEAVTANLSILKSPTILRQTDGRLWCWEGCCDNEGCCAGTCTHVWNYAQALPHLFPELERGLRATEFYESQDEKGHQQFRASLPIRPAAHDFHAAADGQLGGIMKVYRDWRISGSDEWLRSIWDRVKKSLDYCINTWDKKEEGIIKEPHHNTYDIEFWGPDPMCTSMYLGALKAAAVMAEKLGENPDRYLNIYMKGREFLEKELFNGEYFEQHIMRDGLEATLTAENNFPETRELLEKEGPKYQYGSGCLSDGVIGAWMAEVCGLGEIVDNEKVKSHLCSVYKYNFKKDLSHHANPQRPGYAVGNEGGLLLCSWPRGGKPALPFVYSDEVWTGIEYQVASHLIFLGEVEKGLDIVMTCRDRYDGSVRNPFNEYECGHWYARAMSSYSLLQAMTGVRYDATQKVMYIKSAEKKDFTTFLATVSGYGLVGMKDGKAFVEVKKGTIPVKEFVFC